MQAQDVVQESQLLAKSGTEERGESTEVEAIENAKDIQSDEAGTPDESESTELKGDGHLDKFKTSGDVERGIATEPTQAPLRQEFAAPPVCGNSL